MNSPLPLPSALNPALTSARLSTVALWLLEELWHTESDLSRVTDGAYTRGCASFGRQHSRLTQEWKSGKHEWFGLINGANDIVFSVGGVPCRFSSDNPVSPSKAAVLVANQYQASFADFAEQGAPARFCFIIDRGVNEDQDPRVVFQGFTPGGAVVCEWISDWVRKFTDESEERPEAVALDKPQVFPKRVLQDEGGAAESGSQ